MGPWSPKGQTTVAGSEVVGVPEDVAAPPGLRICTLACSLTPAREASELLFLSVVIQSKASQYPGDYTSEGARKRQKFILPRKGECPWRRQLGQRGAAQRLRCGPDRFNCQPKVGGYFVLTPLPNKALRGDL